jgi:hypothetical protein
MNNKMHFFEKLAKMKQAILAISISGSVACQQVPSTMTLGETTPTLGSEVPSSQGSITNDILDPAVSAQAVAGTSGPQGIFVVDDGDADFSTALKNSNVTGALVRVYWSQVETKDNTYDFTRLCTKLTDAHKLSKLVTIANMIVAVPSWLLNSLPTSDKYTNGGFGTQPLPWSTTAQTKMKEFADAEANFSCGGYAIKNHPAVRNVDTPILGMQSIRNAPTNYNINTLTTAVLGSVDIWIDAFSDQVQHNYYVGLFPVTTSSSKDAISIRDSILKSYPSFNFYQETWTGAGPSGLLAEALAPNTTTRTFNVMLQACGYWSQTTRIKCTFASNDNPKAAYDNIAKKLFKAKYLEIYPDDINNSAYQTQMSYIKGDIAK